MITIDLPTRSIIDLLGVFGRRSPRRAAWPTRADVAAASPQGGLADPRGRGRRAGDRGRGRTRPDELDVTTVSEHDMDAVVGRATEQLNLHEDALAGLRAVTARASSESDQVTAEVDGNGTLTGLWMDDSISSLDACTLAAMITSTTQEAARLAAEQRIQVMTTLQDGFGKV
ncbi:YbaB/EbfC family nucleoid-associated protein [Rhodococcus jostii]|uniref:YbaB/EbfC DNA-binding family protein n=1 Tax=Rhodococcus jostii TaxID=132919 RepID=A0A1H5JAM2_RHOJO|nr:YbaB/EbfC family nucleoid-associated protein [Rhodococcus jostii]SEE49519.1 YbaB/EbfC DNA-binding family protein [Rhodococcus jostii]